MKPTLDTSKYETVPQELMWVLLGDKHLPQVLEIVLDDGPLEALEYMLSKRPSMSARAWRHSCRRGDMLRCALSMRFYRAFIGREPLARLMVLSAREGSSKEVRTALVFHRRQKRAAADAELMFEMALAASENNRVSALRVLLKQMRQRTFAIDFITLLERALSRAQHGTARLLLRQKEVREQMHHASVFRKMVKSNTGMLGLILEHCGGLFTLTELWSLVPVKMHDSDAFIAYQVAHSGVTAKAV